MVAAAKPVAVRRPGQAAVRTSSTVGTAAGRPTARSPRHRAAFVVGVAGKPSRCPQITDMCGRYASFLPPEFLARLFATVNPLPNLQPTWNLAPTDDAPVVRLDRETGARHLDV